MNEPKLNAKSIMEMGGGSFLERIDYEMARVMNNILDANTKATEKRKLTVTLTFTPDDDRTTIGVSMVAKATLAPTNPAVTSLYLMGQDGTGEVQAVEMVPQIPGQTSLDGTEQEAPSTLKIIQFA